MRKFGNDALEFMAFTLGDDETVYELPLAASLPFETLIELQDASDKGGAESMRCQMALLRRYMGDAAGELTAAQVTEIYRAWTEESAKFGATAGE